MALLEMHSDNWVKFDKRIPMALVFGFLLQTGGALFWAGAAAQRISAVEERAKANSSAVERVVRLEEQVRGMSEQLDRIENKIDRMTPDVPPLSR